MHYMVILQFLYFLAKLYCLLNSLSLTQKCQVAYTYLQRGWVQNSAWQGKKYCLNELHFSLAVLSAGTIRLHTSGTRGVGVQERGCHHRYRPIRPTLVDRRDGESQGSLSSYLCCTLPYIGLCPFVLSILKTLSLILSRKVLLNLVSLVSLRVFFYLVWSSYSRLI